MEIGMEKREDYGEETESGKDGQQEKSKTADSERRCGMDLEGLFQKLSGENGSVISINNINIMKENSGIITGDQTSIEDIDVFPKEKIKTHTEKQGNGLEIWECFIDNDEKLMEWLTEHYNDFDMAFLIALAVFEKTPYLWVYDAAEELFCMMDNEKEDIQSAKVKTANIQRIKSVGGKRYIDVIYNHTGKVENEFVCFVKTSYAKNVLTCVWKEYIFLRKILVKWLNKYISNKNYSKATRAIKAMAFLARYDFDFFSREVIRMLLLRKEILADYAVAQIMSQIYIDRKYQGNIDKIFEHWAKIDSVHYSLIALMICLESKWEQKRIELVVEKYIDKLIQNARMGIFNEYERELPTFFAITQRKAVCFKAIVTVFYEKLKMYEERRYRTERNNICAVFFLFLLIDDGQSNIDILNSQKNKDMIFVKMCLVNNDIALKTRELWKALWKNKEVHRPVKELLERYLYQFGGCNQQQIAYLKKFLYSFIDTDTDRENMDYFLKKISWKSQRPVKAAERVQYQWR